MMRRRKNPSLSEITNFGTLALVGIGGYLLYKLLAPTIQGAGSLGSAITSGIAKLFPGTGSNPDTVLAGSVALSNGAQIPMSSLTSNGFNADGTLSMSDAAGNTYNVSSGSTPGTYTGVEN